MLIKFKYFITIIFCFFSLNIIGRNSGLINISDTIFVYDTVAVYDTVYVCDTVKIREELPDLIKAIDYTILKIDSLAKNTEVILFFNNKSATIPVDSIILNENNKNKSMKPKKILGITLALLQGISFGQENNNTNTKPENYFNYILKGNLACQIFSYPKNQDYGKDLNGPLKSFTHGINYNISISEKFSIVPQLNYILKGAAYRHSGYGIAADQNGITWQGNFDTTFKNTFNYLSLDIIVKYKLSYKKLINPYFHFGIKNDLLMKSFIEYDLDVTSGNRISYFPYSGSNGLINLYRTNYPDNSGYKDFNLYNCGGIIGFGLDYKTLIFFEIEHNFDLGYIVKNDQMLVKNWVWSANIGFNINKLLSKKSSKKDCPSYP